MMYNNTYIFKIYFNFSIDILYITIKKEGDI